MIELISSFDVKSFIIALCGVIMLFGSLIAKHQLNRLKALEQAERLRVIAENKLVSRDYIETQFEISNKERKSMHETNMQILNKISERIELLAVHEMRLKHLDDEVNSLRQDRHAISKVVQTHEGKLDFISRQLQTHNR